MKQLLSGVAVALVLLVAAPVLAQTPMTPSGLHGTTTQANTTTAPIPLPTTQSKTTTSQTPERTTQSHITFPATPELAGQANSSAVQPRQYNHDTIANRLNARELKYGVVPPPVARRYPPPGFPPPTYFPFASPPRY
jgi:hypothetical protein